MNVVSLERRMLMPTPRVLGLSRYARQTWDALRFLGCSCGGSLDLGDGAAGRLPHRDRAVAVLDAVFVEDLEALLLPGARDAEDRDRLAGVLVELQASLDHAAGDDVDPGVGD